jgi:hypothetical protein
VSVEPPEAAPQQEHGGEVRARLPTGERAALLARLDTNPIKADWALYDRELEAILAASAPLQ